MPDLSKQLSMAIQPLLQKIQQHPLFSAITSIVDLQRFAEIHVFAVWDFMCLIKALQRQLMCNDTLWLPPTDYLGCRLLHEMVMEEETDKTSDGRYGSHFDWYLAAMRQCGANTQNIDALIQAIRQQTPLETIFKTCPIPLPAIAFMRTTFHLMEQPVHVVASAVAYGREQITEKMFTPILMQLNRQTSSNHTSKTMGIDLFIAYFQRHIDLDGGKHGELSQRLVANLCGNDRQKWQEATQGALLALESRLQLLDGIYAYLRQETFHD